MLMFCGPILMMTFVHPKISSKFHGRSVEVTTSKDLKITIAISSA